MPGSCPAGFSESRYSHRISSLNRWPPGARAAKLATVIQLRVIFIAQLVIMLPVFALLLVTPVYLGTVAIYVYLTPIGLAAALYALWQFIKHPARRRLAGATLATPVLCLGAPVVVYWLNGGPVAPAVLVVAVLALLAIAGVVLLATTDQWHGAGMFASRKFNYGCLVALGALFLMLWFPIVAGLAASDAISLPTEIAELDQVYSVAALYFIALAVPAACLSIFTLLYAPVGLVRNRGGRVVHLGQLVSALLLLISLTAVAFAVSVFMVNPG